MTGGRRARNLGQHTCSAFGDSPRADSAERMLLIARAAYEEGRILWNRKPIDDVLARKDLSPDVRTKLETVLAVRKFAAEKLGENVGGAYKSIAPVDQSAIVYVVMAAPRDSLEPYTWWFPIVGRVPYRGYFDESDALAEAASLEAQGLDTMVRPSIAFSSLGFFDDPLPDESAQARTASSWPAC